MVRWHLATDKQLEVIFNHDANDGCDNELLVDLVSEMIVRKKLDGMIIKQAENILGVYDRSEVLQMGYIAVFQLAKIYQRGKLSFKSMCFIAIERRLKTILQVQNQKKNTVNRNALKNEVPEMPDDRNIEWAVIRKMQLQEQMDKLNDKERMIVGLFLDGYSLRWIDINVFNEKPTYCVYYFKKALKKMGITNFKVKERTAA